MVSNSFFVIKKLGKAELKILWDKIEEFGGDISDRVNDNTTHWLFHQGDGYKTGLESLNLISLQDMVSTVTNDWLSDCTAARNLIPTTEFEVS